MPHLQYSILTWGFNTNRLDKLQKRPARTITCSKYNAHTDPLFKRLNLLKLNDIFKLCTLKFYYKYEYNQLPSFFSNMFQNSSHSHYTRHRENFYQGTPKTLSGVKCIRYFLPSLLRDTPPCIKDKVITHSFHGFTTYCKKHLIDTYSDCCNIPNCYVCSH